MSLYITSTVVILKTVTFLLGGLITFYAFKAYRRTEAPALRLLAIGFGAITLGSLLAGVADLLFALDRDYALIIESALTALGFTIIMYSLYR